MPSLSSRVFNNIGHFERLDIRDSSPEADGHGRLLDIPVPVLPEGTAEESLPAGRVTIETDYFRLVGDLPKIGPAAFPIKVQPVFAESHAAAVKHTVIRVEKTMGVVKAYLQLKAVTATKQMASAHAMLRTRAKVSAGSPPSSHANTAANKRNTEKKSPNALKKSQ
jgi:hypothetical protein